MVPPERRCSLDFPIVWQAAEHRLDQALGDRGVGHDRKMRAVLLGRGDRQDRERRIRIEPGKFARLELRPEPLGHHESFSTNLVVTDALAPTAWYSKSPAHPGKR